MMSFSTIENISDIISLHWILESSDWTFEEIKEHLERGFFYVDERDSYDRTPLISILEKDNCSIDVVKLLLRNKASVDKVDCYGRTPLLVLLESENCSADLVRLLLRYGAKVNYSDKMGTSPLISALRHTREAAIIKILLKRGADPRRRQRHHPSPLCVALCCDAPREVVDLLLDAGCPLHACRIHRSALHCAISSFQGIREGVLDTLLGAGARLDRVGRHGQQLLCFAIQHGCGADDIQLLLKKGASLKCHRHKSPLLCATSPYVPETRNNQPASRRGACQGGAVPPEAEPFRPPMFLRAAVVQLLLKTKPKVNACDGEGCTALKCALQHCRYETEAIRLMLDGGCRMSSNSRVILGHCPLAKAVFEYGVEPGVVELFLERGLLSACRVDDNGNTLLHRAVANERELPSLIRVLLRKGSRVNATNRRRQTTLEVAIRTSKGADVLGMLLAAGASIKLRKKKICYLMHCAFRVYDCRRLEDERKIAEREDCLKTLLKFCYLENFFFETGCLRFNFVSKPVKDFENECKSELHAMQQLKFRHATLYDFLAQRKTRLESDELDQLLRILRRNSFPTYIDRILAKVDKSLLKTKLLETPVYCTTTSDSLPFVRQKVFLIVDCVHEVISFLTKQDLAVFILAFCELDGGCKRSAVGDDQAASPKHRRLS